MVDDVSGVGPVPKEFHGEALCNALAEEPLRLLASVLLTALVEDEDLVPDDGHGQGQHSHAVAANLCGEVTNN